MMKIRYAGGEFLTGDKIAVAVLAYAAALANRARGAQLDVPARDLAGQPTKVMITVGPASQFMAEETRMSDMDELVDERFVASLEALTADLAR